MTLSIRFSILTSFIALLFIATRVEAHPSRVKRADSSNTVQITSSTDFCMIFPRDPHTDIGVSENGGSGTIALCTNPSDGSQGISPEFWTSVIKAQPPGNGDIMQLTGCINPATVDRLNANDPGGQYDSSGGADGNGNPAGSMCTGYNHYVELIEPFNKRACIRCCSDALDCPTTKDTTGCPGVIPADNYNC